MTREFAPDGSVVLARDHAPILYLKGTVWHCPLCHPGGSIMMLAWVNVGSIEDPQRLGRCYQCGQKYVLAPVEDRNVPTVDEQLAWREARRRPRV